MIPQRLFRGAGRRRAAIALGATVAVLAAGPAAALAKGWTLHLKGSVRGATTKTIAKHCGKTKFGTWTFRESITVEGTVARLRWRTIVTGDGAPHPVSALRVTGSASTAFKASLRQTIAGLRFHYIAGSPPKLGSQLPDGATFATMAFRPKQTRGC